ncbi:MAG TPA: IS256 family transposase [Terriglobia bacterium]|nr:IS256 family transposase [Terriglobia bacterium]
MKKATPITEQFQHFVEELQETFWGDLYGKTKGLWQKLLEEDSEAQMARYLGLDPYERGSEERPRKDSRNGYYERVYDTVLGAIRLRIRRTRQRSFLPKGVEKLQRRAPELALLIREAFLRGISTRQVGQVVATLTEEPVSAQTVSQLTRCLNQKVEEFQRAGLADDWVYLFLDGIWLKVRRATGTKKVLLLVAYGVQLNGKRQLITFLRAQSESQNAWEGLLNDLQQRGLKGHHLKLILTDGCAGLAAALETVYPRVLHQRCWVHKMRNILEKVRKCDYDQVKRGAQALYLAANRQQAQQAFKQFRLRWQKDYPTMVKQLEKDLPELLNFYYMPKLLWRSLRTTNVIERCFVEVRRRTRPMVTFVNIQSVDRIIFAIFNRFNQEWKNRTLKNFTHAA